MINIQAAINPDISIGISDYWHGKTVLMTAKQLHIYWKINGS